MKTPFFWPVRVYYEDTDVGGVVYHANYLKFFERARTEHLRSLGFELDELRAASGVLFAVRAAQVDYLKPARFNDSLRVSSEVRELKRASMNFYQEILRGDLEGEKLCQALIRIVCLTDGELRPIAMPGFFWERIKNVT